MFLSFVSIFSFCLKPFFFCKGDSSKWILGLYILAQTGFVKSGSDMKHLHACVREKHWNVRFIFVLWLFCYQRLKLRSPEICKSQEYDPPPLARFILRCTCVENPWCLGREWLRSYHAHSPFCFWQVSQCPPVVSLLDWFRPVSCCVWGILVWALGLLCAVHL